MAPRQLDSARWHLISLYALAAYGCESQADGPSGHDAGVHDAGVIDAGDASRGGRGGSGGGGGGGSQPVCHVDIPCFGRLAQCVGAKQYQPYRDVSCHEICGDRACSGGACRASGDIVDCPSGQQCSDVPNPSGMASAQCVPFLDDAGVCGDIDGGDVPGCIVAWGCGDGRVDTYHSEGCDDGNRVDGDGCDRNCKREQGFDCPMGGGPCASLQLGDVECPTAACRQGSGCVELATGLACLCPAQQDPAACGSLSLQSLPVPQDRNRFNLQSLSRDGRVIGGRLGRSDMMIGGAAIWSSDLGTHLLPVEGSYNLTVIALSGDGSVQLLDENAVDLDHKASGVLLQNDKLLPEGDLPIGFFTDIDDSGHVLVGNRITSGSTEERAFRFKDGELLDLGVLDASACPEPACEPRTSHAAAISGDGTVIVGSAGPAAFRWNAESGMRRLEVVNPEATSSALSYAIDVSADGSYVLGWSSAIPTPSSGMVRWNAKGEVESIPVPRQEHVHRVDPLAISADGRVIVGTLHFDEGVADSAFIWDDVRGPRELIDALSTTPQIAGWHFDSAVAVSGNGTLVAGNGSYRGHPVAYVARVAPP